MRLTLHRPFAWQEAQMALALILQNFNLRLDDPGYELRVKQTLTIKPDGFFMHSTLREGITAQNLQTRLTSSLSDAAKDDVHASIARLSSGLEEGLKPMTILYGSNTGTCQALAQKLSVEARRHGFQANTMELDAMVGHLPKDQPVAIISSSYEGEPPDNAAQFVAWLESLEKTNQNRHLENVTYAVFGCGHSDWVSTFQRIPTLLDNLIAQCGGQRMTERGSANASEGDIFGDFDLWTERIFWPAVAPDTASSRVSTLPAFDVEMSRQNRSSYLRQDVKPATVLEANTLTALGEPEKRHLRVKLPEGMTYDTGDYLAILPLNPTENVTRIMKHFEMPNDSTIMIKPEAATFLPTSVTLSVIDLLTGFVELGLPATRRDIQACMLACMDSEEKGRLEAFLEKNSYAEITENRVSLLDLLIKYPSIGLNFSTFISMLPPLRPRHYSISSSPLADAQTCTITYGIINEEAKSGVGKYIGVAGSYLAGLRPQDEVQVSVRATNKYFHLPADQSATPILMFGAGTGIAPFRGFIEERSTQMRAGKQVAPAIILMGCRSETRDRLYANEVDAWAKTGAVDVRYAFSGEPEKSEGCKYIHERFLKDRDDIRKLWDQGAKVYVCSAPAVSEDLARAARQLLIGISEAENGKALSEEEAARWFSERRNERFVVDVFA